jgi:hypothetical protein
MFIVASLSLSRDDASPPVVDDTEPPVPSSQVRRPPSPLRRSIPFHDPQIVLGNSHPAMGRVTTVTTHGTLSARRAALTVVKRIAG